MIKYSVFDKKRTNVILEKWDIHDEDEFFDELNKLTEKRCSGIFAKVSSEDEQCNERMRLLSHTGFELVNKQYVSRGYGASLDLDYIELENKRMERLLNSHTQLSVSETENGKTVTISHMNMAMAQLTAEKTEDLSYLVRYRCFKPKQEDQFVKLVLNGTSIFELLLTRLLRDFRYGGAVIFELDNEKQVEESMGYFDEFEKTIVFYEFFWDTQEA